MVKKAKRQEKIKLEKRAIRKAAEHQPKTKAVVNKELSVPTIQLQRQHDTSSPAKEARKEKNKNKADYTPDNNDNEYNEIIQAQTNQEVVQIKITHVPSTSAVVSAKPLQAAKNKSNERTPQKLTKKESKSNCNVKQQPKLEVEQRSQIKPPVEHSLSPETPIPITGSCKSVEKCSNVVVNDNIPPVTMAEKKRIREFIRKRKYKRPEAKEREFMAPDIRRLMNLPKGYHGSAQIIKEMKKKYEETGERNKTDREEIEKEFRQATGHEFKLTRNIVMHRMTWSNLEEVVKRTNLKNNPMDRYLCPDREEGSKILKKFCRLKRNQMEEFTDVIIQRNRKSDHFARVLSRYRELQERLNCIRTRRSKDRLGANVILGQIKLLNSILRNMSLKVAKGFSKFESTSMKEWRKKLREHEFLCNHLQNKVEQMVKCVEKKKLEISEQGKLFVQTKHECIATEKELERTSADYEQRVLVSEPYKEITEIGNTLRNDIPNLKQHIEKQKSILQEVEKQLVVCRNTPKCYDRWTREWGVLKESMNKRLEEMTQRQRKQAILKEMIRIKTGVILKEEIKHFQLQNEMKSLTEERERLAEHLNDISYQRKKLSLKYKRFSDFVPEQQCAVP